MGQVRGVTVHRLLMTETIDEKLRQLVLYKQGLFNEYADKSVIGQKDIEMNETEWLKKAIEEERGRLGIVS